MSAYINSLNEYVRQHQNESQANARDPGSRLRDSIARWHALLPSEMRQSPWIMSQLVHEFGASPMALGKALAELGWIRKRNWRGLGTHARFWTPPPL